MLNGNQNKEELQRLQECQLNILKMLDDMCSKNRLQYCLAFGSCLGAIRHKGFVPWDDDIDVYMPIKDFEKLKAIGKNFPQPYFFQTQESDPEYGLAIGRIRNSNTTLIEKNENNRNINHGVFVDIYPLYNTPETGFKNRQLIIYSMIYRLFLYGKVPQNRGIIYKIGAGILLKLTPSKSKKNIITACRKALISTPDTGWISTFYGDESKVVYPKAWFFPVQQVDFEDINTYIPFDSDSYLKRTYGNYWELPPEDKRCFHHTYRLIDLDNSYTKYRGVEYYKK